MKKWSDTVEFRNLNEKEIDVRIQKISDDGVTLVLYKSARCDMNILDETVGATRWQRRHYECKGNLFCSVGIYDDTLNQWIYKDDCGSESFIDKEKGEASDSFKRACFNWGIGRELYTSPNIWISFKKGNVTKEYKNNKTTTYDKFEVEKIRVENGVITGLSIKNITLNKRVFACEKEVRL